MTRPASQAVQAALFATLTSDSTLMALVSGVYDRVKEQTAFPYVTIGEVVSEDWSSLSHSGESCVVTLHGYSRKGGRKETRSIIERLCTLLHRASLSVTGWQVIELRYLQSEVTLEADGLTYHGRASFRLRLRGDAEAEATLAIGNGAQPVENFVLAGGLTDLAIHLENRPVNTETVSSGPWQALMAFGGQRQARINGKGWTESSTGEAALRAMAFNAAPQNCHFDFRDGSRLSGKFMISELSWQAEAEDGMRYALSLESSGELTFTA